MPQRLPVWTVAAYFAGGEALNEDMIRGLREIRCAATASCGRLRAFAQFDPKGKRPRLFDFGEEGSPGSPSWPFVPIATRSPFENALANFEKVLDARPGAQLPSARERLSGFAEMARAASRDTPVLLVLSGHGSGSVGEFFGHRDAGSLTLPELAEALRGASRRRLDLVGMDCCNMGMVEVAFELRSCARFLVASEGYVPNHGWPYREILEGAGEWAVEEAGVEIVRRYLTCYADYGLLGVSSQCAACEVDRTELLVEPLRGLTSALGRRLRDENAWQPIVLAHWEAQSYKNEEYVDLADFCDRLARYEPDPEIRGLCREVHRVVTDEIVLASGFTGSRFQFSTGLSVYFPWSHDAVKSSGEIRETSPLADYERLAFSRLTGWGGFLDAYLRATRRKPAPRDTAPVEAQEVPAVAMAAR